MTTLHIHFPSHWKGWHVAQFTMKSKTRTAFGLDALVHARVEYAHSNDYYCDSPVFRAWVKTSSGTLLDVALKFALRDDFIDDLEKEASAYIGALEPLQGTVVPRFYGFYTGMDEDGQSIACVMLEHSGECLRRHFAELGLDTRLLILERLRAFHRRGLHHGDFAERNVLQDDSGDIRLIDFDQTDVHDCGGDFFMRPGQRVPRYEDVCCEWLKDICGSYLRIWDLS